MSSDTGHISMRLPHWVLDAVDERARMLGESRSTVIREALRAYLGDDLPYSHRQGSGARSKHERQ